MTQMNWLFLIMAFLLFASVLASRLSARLGMPLLLAFLGVGMLAGEEGIGNISFNNFAGANFVSQLALAVILLDGGLRTKLSTFRIALKPAAVLASWGVLASVGLLGVFTTWLLGLDWRLGLLMAAIVGSTDAAAVFSLLRNSGVRLHPRIQATLELESGVNDPMAILLVSVLISLITQPEQTTFRSALVMLVQQLGLGLLFGLVSGKIFALLLAKIRLAEGLYALMIASGGVLVFALSNLVGGSGFLAVYLAGVLVGNARNSSTEHVLNVMDGLAWLAQAAMFLVLGLLVTPSRLWEQWQPALMIAAFLILVARPIAVYTSIKWFKYSKREIAYISWVGLRGAVPVTLAIMPLMSGVENARLLFDVVFAVVILSLLIQGTTIPFFAKKLDMVLPPEPEPLNVREIWLSDRLSMTMQSFLVGQDSEAQGSHPYAMTRDSRFAGSRLFSLIRNGEPITVNMATQMQAGDIAWYVLDEEQGNAFARQFADDAGSLHEQHFFGEFVVKPEAQLSDLVFAYGIKVAPEEASHTLDSLFRERFGDVPVAGDRIDFDGICITVKQLDEQGNIQALGLKMPKKAQNHV
ncbi:potassium/proton antiporter [Kingella kingae]|uniref:potassium/proton antiporter n=1 Tax=Kingella kingae TaxID=504 RepID=UPI0003FF359C|nr:potassium/proton antiporter [Kingella kingae]MDK4624637.1 potassium/proton antiporter [Kingella kingae]MDK4660269.1 potassium/proton antiporter [Kingella kingae]MDK4668208.1 potassium/proton antiporter [Kingella kingae]MDK4686435.1 potassium/proton antiporter [Kingella kingae]